jgi:hypothetical protein
LQYGSEEEAREEACEGRAEEEREAEVKRMML